MDKKEKVIASHAFFSFLGIFFSPSSFDSLFHISSVRIRMKNGKDADGGIEKNVKP